MDTCDVLIVGGGPAGSSCAWKLRESGLRVAILDRQLFPRNKVCGGWITPAVLEELQIDAGDYARNRMLQPITGFRTSHLGGREVETHYGAPVSFGIRRCEFDDYLLKRSGANLILGEDLSQLLRSGDEWIVNGRLRCRMLVGAGGTFCPVARNLGARISQECVVTAKEAEFEMDDRRLSACSIRPEVPELFFCFDMKGYGWCFRKGNFLNVGLGRMDPHGLPAHVAGFFETLRTSGKIGFDIPAPLGHAYPLYGITPRKTIGDAVLLVGDAAGVAYAQSGEGIRSAVESGILAARTIEQADGCYREERLAGYRDLLTARFGNSTGDWMTAIAGRLPAGTIEAAARKLLETSWFSRAVVLDRWFLHRREPSLVYRAQEPRFGHRITQTVARLRRSVRSSSPIA